MSSSEPLWCAIRQHYCRCHDYGERCDDLADELPDGEEDTGEDTNVEEQPHD